MCVLLPKKFHIGWEQIFNRASVGHCHVWTYMDPALLQHLILGGLALRLLTVVSDESEPVSELENNPALARTKLPPLGKCSGSVFLVILSALEMAFLVKMIMNRSMDGCELL